MKKQNHLVLRAIVVLVVVFGGGWIVGGVLNMAALLSPQMVSKIECPAGSTVKESMSQQSFDQPGQKTLTFACQDQAGDPVAPLSDAQTSALEYRYFYPAGVGLMALGVIAWGIRFAVLGANRGETENSAAS